MISCLNRKQYTAFYLRSLAVTLPALMNIPLSTGWPQSQQQQCFPDNCTWKATPARGPELETKVEKSDTETETTNAAFAHLDARLENDIPLIHSSEELVLVGTTYKIVKYYGIQDCYIKPLPSRLLPRGIPAISALSFLQNR